MLKNISQMKCQIGQKDYIILCDCDSPLEHVKEALFQFQKHVGQIEDRIKQQQKEQSSEQPIEEEIKTEG